MSVPFYVSIAVVLNNKNACSATFVTFSPWNSKTHVWSCRRLCSRKEEMTLCIYNEEIFKVSDL